METMQHHCEHMHSCCHSKHHEDSHEYTIFILPIISFSLLITGIILQHQSTWFQNTNIQFIWFLCSFLPVGFPVMKEAWKSLLTKDLFNEFSLMVIASVGAFAIGEYPEAVAVMLFYTIGEILQDKAVDRATRNIRQLLDVRPEQVEVFRNGRYHTVSPREVKIGEIIEIKPGGRIPLDGILKDSQAIFDTSALTGESVPRTISKNEEVLAGMIISGQAVHIQVSKTYENSSLARILELVQNASERKAPSDLFIPEFARIYTPVVVLSALLIIIIPALISIINPSFHYIFNDWLYRGLVFLVISCPCALVISVPLGYFGGIGAASRNGILFKGGNFLNAITHINAIAFDKTGTLTTGSFEVISVAHEGITQEQLLYFISSVEQKSNHPIAQAIVHYAKKQGIEISNENSIHELSGLGIEAEINEKKILVGNARLMKKYQINLPQEIQNCTSTIVLCAVNEKYVGHLLLSDTLKNDACKAIKNIRKLGISDIRLLSGDKKEIVNNFASLLGIDKAFGDLLPEDKVHYLEQMTTEPNKSVAFVGDGMNDAPVLALSDVGIAMGGLGSDAAIETADVVIQTDQPSKVATAISIGYATKRIIMQNIVGAIGAKSLILLAGAFGFATLWAAVFADVGVALIAVLNSMRILKMKFQ